MFDSVVKDISDRVGRILGHVIVDSSALPSGAATSAKQPALGTAGTASADVISVQGVAGGTAVPVSGTFWQATQPVSAASLPLPTGAGTLTDGTASVTASAAALATLSAKSVLLQSDPSNTVTILIGTSSTQHIALLPGQAARLAVSNLNLLYAKTASGTATLNYLVAA